MVDQGCRQLDQYVAVVRILLREILQEWQSFQAFALGQHGRQVGANHGRPLGEAGEGECGGKL